MHKDVTHPVAVKLRQAAKLLNISERTLWDLVQRGEVPVRVIRHGARRTYLFSVSELERWARGDQPANPQRPMGESGQ
jgi:excisionase family DNA binding protein